jgi:two-component system, OmpR family, phosphate regulon response regulator PhoB
MAAESPFRILLVDDEPLIRELVRTMLTTGTVEVEVASNGAECLRAARTRPFDLVLLDIVLPGLDGISLCRMLRSDPSTAQVPVYMLTAKARPSDVETAQRAGADGYIHKPFRGAELTDLVEMLQRKKAR